jgi:hypothetical protein
VTDIAITPLDAGSYGVQVTEGDVTTSYKVRVPNELFDDLDLRDIEPATIVRKSFEFLLEREPATSILSEFSLTDIARYFSEYYDELQRRVAP